MEFIQRPSILAPLSISLLFILWYGLAIFLNSDTLPDPITVIHVLIHEVQTGGLPLEICKIRRQLRLCLVM